MGPCYGVGHDDGGRMAGVQPPSYPADMALDQTEPRSGFCRFVRRAPARNRSACERKHGAGDNTVRRAIVARLQGPRPPRAGRSGKCPAFREPPHDPPRTDLRRPITLTCFWMLTLRDAHRHLHRVRPRRGPTGSGPIAHRPMGIGDPRRASPGKLTRSRQDQSRCGQLARRGGCLRPLGCWRQR